MKPLQIPTAEEASKTAYELQTAASANAAGVVQAPSGRGVRKHVCLHPGCGKVFHLKASALTHQEKEHHFRRRLGEKIGNGASYLNRKITCEVHLCFKKARDGDRDVLLRSSVRRFR